MRRCGSLFMTPGVAVTVAVRCRISRTFQAFSSGPLCAQDLCKLLVNCELLESGWMSPPCLLISRL
jgi:hypothetical protein